MFIDSTNRALGRWQLASAFHQSPFYKNPTKIRICWQPQILEQFFVFTIANIWALHSWLIWNKSKIGVAWNFVASSYQVHKIVDLSAFPDREAMWYLEVIEAYKLFYGPNWRTCMFLFRSYSGEIVNFVTPYADCSPMMLIEIATEVPSWFPSLANC